jgi:hypothetical protein
MNIVNDNVYCVLINKAQVLLNELLIYDIFFSISSFSNFYNCLLDYS